MTSGYKLLMCWLTQTTDRRVSTGDAEEGHVVLLFTQRLIYNVCYALCEANKIILTAVLVCQLWQQKFKSQTEGKQVHCVFLTSSFTPVAYGPLRCVCLWPHIESKTCTHSDFILAFRAETVCAQQKKASKENWKSITHVKSQTLSISTCYIRAPFPHRQLHSSLTESMSNPAWERKWV